MDHGSSWLSPTGPGNKACRVPLLFKENLCKHLARTLRTCQPGQQLTIYMSHSCHKALAELVSKCPCFIQLWLNYSEISLALWGRFLVLVRDGYSVMVPSFRGEGHWKEHGSSCYSAKILPCVGDFSYRAEWSNLTVLSLLCLCSVRLNILLCIMFS